MVHDLDCQTSEAQAMEVARPLAAGHVVCCILDLSLCHLHRQTVIHAVEGSSERVFVSPKKRNIINQLSLF